ncbi:MAG: tetratricopeptide repeat protein [Mycobacterium sp.]
MTRPRSSIGPALAGAVDLSALKQRAQAADQKAGAPPAAGNGPAAGVEITEANFQTEVLARSNEVPVVVVLLSPRSEASLQLADSLSELAAADSGTWVLGLVNVDTNGRVAQAFGVQAIPTVVALAAGQPISSFEGVQPPDQLRRWVDSLISAMAGKLGGSANSVAEEIDPAVAQALAFLDEGDFGAALQAYEDIVASDPGHAEAKAAIRQIKFHLRASDHPNDAVAVADKSPDDIDAALAAADVEILQQAVAAAFARLIALVRRTAGDDRVRVRTHLIELFDLFDPADPDVIAARRNLANALY